MSGTDETKGGGAGAERPWTRAEFEAAIPLYVGGDLEPGDAERVERWIAAHPEDAAVVRAADEARSVLLAHARRFEQRETPDLLPGIREELARQNGGMARVSGRQIVGGAADVDRPAAPLAAAAAHDDPAANRRSWFERPAFAAAAALLFVSTLALGIARIGVGPGTSAGLEPVSPGAAVPGPAVPGAASEAPSAADRFAGVSRPLSGSASGAAISGTDELPLDVTPTGVTARRRAVPLRPTGGNAEHLLPSATPVHPWFPALDLSDTPATSSGVRLTGQR